MRLHRLVLAINLLALAVNARPFANTPPSPQSLTITRAGELDPQANTKLVPADEASPNYYTNKYFEILNTDASYPADDGQAGAQPSGVQTDHANTGKGGQPKYHGHRRSGLGHHHSGLRYELKYEGINETQVDRQEYHSRHHKANSEAQKHQGDDQSSIPGGDTFLIYVVNQCSDAKDAGIYGVTSSFQPLQYCEPVNIAPGQSHALDAPFNGTGLRLTANAQEGVSNVFQAQSLFEFGYSEYAGKVGTSYDLSLMKGSQIGLAVDVLENGAGSGSCESKKCVDPSNCDPSQAWTDPNQASIGSPADTTCYQGKTNFRVTLCPS